MREIRVITIQLDSRTGLFDNSPLLGYLRDRELLHADAAFFQHAGRPAWSVLVQTRPLQGGSPQPEPASEESEKGEKGGRVEGARQAGERAAFKKLLQELDEAQRDRYERLCAWRRGAARKHGVPAYVVLTNAQALELARNRPTTLAAVAAVDGLGVKRIKRHGKAILEVLGVPITKARSQGGDPLRAVDGPDALAPGPDGALPEAPAPQPDRKG